MKFLQDNKFNAIRFLFNHASILNDATLEAPNTEIYGADAPWEAPELENYKYLDMFLKLAEVAAEHGDRRTPSPAPQGGAPAEPIPPVFVRRPRHAGLPSSQPGGVAGQWKVV